ncbi:MAG: nitroreductase family protein, partial [Candidatus Bathyarchaeota archaeon]|nr:nitroreductase family protein [Candidatus Bathyarchaeota archaeon]
MGRRSVRRYKDKKIPDEIIIKLLKAAMNAPSAHNKQPWHFIVVDD